LYQNGRISTLPNVDDDLPFEHSCGHGAPEALADVTVVGPMCSLQPFSPRQPPKQRRAGTSRQFK
jgi:hypothetical protein